MKKNLTPILTSTLLSAIAQVTLKTGMTLYGKIEPGLDMILAVLHPIVFLGLALYFIGAMIWIIALSKNEVSYAYPFASLAYVIVALLGWLFLNEQVKLLRIIGITIIILGVYVISKSENKTK